MNSGYTVTAISIHSPSALSPFNAFERQEAADARERFNGISDKKDLIANLTDDEILLTSAEYAQRKTDKTVAGKLKNALPSLFAIGVPLLFGALSKGKLSDKVKTGLGVAVVFAGMNTIFNKYNKGISRLENVSESFEENRKEHPVKAFIFDLAAKAALVLGATYMAVKGGKYIQNKFTPTVEKLTASISKASKKMDETALGRGVQKLNDRTESFLSKHPKISKAVSNDRVITTALTILGMFGLETAILNKAQDNKNKFAESAAEELFMQREIARNI